jgi:hypothetical protein
VTVVADQGNLAFEQVPGAGVACRLGQRSQKEAEQQGGRAFLHDLNSLAERLVVAEARRR